MASQLQKETQLKETKIGLMPDDWNISSYFDLAQYINGYGFKPSEWKEEGLPIIRIQNLNGNDEYNYFDGEIKPEYIVNNGDLLFSWSATIDIFEWRGGKAVLNQHIFKVIPKKDVDKDFLFYAIKHYLDIIRSRIQGSTMKHFKKKQLQLNFLPLPEYSEQRRISSLLNKYRELIRRKNEQVERLTKIRNKSLELLFTKSIITKETKSASIGEIPKTWECVKLSRVAKFEMGQSPPSKAYNKEQNGKPFLQGNAEFGDLYPSEIKYTTNITKTAPKGSLLISIRAPVGEVNIADKEYCIGRGLSSIWLKNNEDNMFLYYLFQHIRPKLERMSTGSTFKAVNKSHFDKLYLQFPDKEERIEIVKKLTALDSLIDVKKKKIRKLENMFQYTMGKLLSGKVRVK